MSLQKKNTLTVEDWPRPKVGKRYKGLVKQIRADKKTKSLRVSIENLDPGMQGRLHQTDFPLPLRPGNRTSLFLTACGMEANTIGKQICIDDIVGAVFGMRFSAADGSDKQIEFERIETVAEDRANNSVTDQEDQALL